MSSDREMRWENILVLQERGMESQGKIEKKIWSQKVLSPQAVQVRRPVLRDSGRKCLGWWHRFPMGSLGGMGWFQGNFGLRPEISLVPAILGGYGAQDQIRECK